MYNFSTCIIYVTDIVTQVVTATLASLEPRVRRVVLLTNTRVLVLRGSLDKIVMKSRVKIGFKKIVYQYETFNLNNHYIFKHIKNHI